MPGFEPKTSLLANNRLYTCIVQNDLSLNNINKTQLKLVAGKRSPSRKGKTVMSRYNPDTIFEPRMKIHPGIVPYMYIYVHMYITLN